ncbi:hypothetical protein MGG_13350 [Pyricularia oryzae 70-15]|nr:uncharacterized protein MGG_13350 [Pyricularia oryzae 70-15]EHA51431.1 hypothetical protein MGG_13350 [Pyricularia oryzae 70-15]
MSEQSPAAPLPAKKRKAHRKSRTGCLGCRIRRVKCDEGRPRCRACLRRNESCRYPDESAPVKLTTSEGEAPRARATSNGPSLDLSPTGEALATPALLPDRTRLDGHGGGTVAIGQLLNSPHDASTPSSASTPNTATTPAYNDAAIPSGLFGIRDLALLHHWTVSTSSSIFNSADVNDLWQVTFPQVGLEYPFVAHAILAVAALHRSYLDGSQGRSGLLDEAASHHEKSLAGFHDVVQHLTAENCEGLLAWSLLNILYTFALSRQLAGRTEGSRHQRHLRQQHSRKDRLLGVEWIPMIRGVDAVLSSYYHSLLDGRMARLLTFGNWKELQLRDDDPDPMDAELRRIRGAWADDNPDAGVYDEALHILRKCRAYTGQFATMDADTLSRWDCNRGWAGPMAFVHFAPERYFTLLHQRQPPALVLFAYFGAFFHVLDGYWYLETWGREIVEVVDDILGSYWRPWIQIPATIVGLE